MSICGDLTLVKKEHNRREAITLPCRSWTCDHCQPTRRAKLIAQAIHGKPDTFVTLTSRRVPGQTPDGAAADLSRAWRLIRKRAIREAKRDLNKGKAPYGAQPPVGWQSDANGHYPNVVRLRDDRLPFLAVFEATANGWPHLHILCRSIWIDQRWLSAQADELLQSPVVDVRRINDTDKIAGYCAKYVGKDPHRFGTTKRYWSSQDYAPGFLYHEAGDGNEATGWHTVSDPLDTIAEHWKWLGWDVEWTGYGRVVARRTDRVRDPPWPA